MSKTVLVTGCSSGIGKAAVLKFRSAGWRVVATMRNADHWTEDPIDSILPLSLDVRDESSVKAAFDTAVGRFGGIDCVVNNAGAGLFSVFEATPMEAMHDVFDTNFFGPLRVMRAALPHFKANGGGRFVNLTSAAAISPEPLMTIYAASKSALDAFSESVQFELRTENITVKVVVPGFVPTTSFVQQTQVAAQAIPVPTPFQTYVNQRIQSYMSELPFTAAGEDDVATAILAAATDDTEKLRFIVGPDAELLAHMRWEASEERYNAWNNARFS